MSRKLKGGGYLHKAGSPEMKKQIYYHYKHNHSMESSLKSPKIIKQKEKIAERRAQMPRAYRATYDRAVKGKSLRAAVNAQCLECVCWQRKEVTLCTDLACPLYAVRPYQLPQNGRDGGFICAESKNPES